MYYFYVLTCFIEKLNLETIDNIVEVDLCPKLGQLILLRVFEAHYWVKDNAVLVHDQVTHYFAFTCTQVNRNKQVDVVIRPVQKFIDCNCFLEKVLSWLKPGSH